MKKTYFNSNLFNGVDNKIIADAWFTVDEETGKITETGTRAPANNNEGEDLHGQYVMRDARVN